MARLYTSLLPGDQGPGVQCLFSVPQDVSFSECRRVTEATTFSLALKQSKQQHPLSLRCSTQPRERTLSAHSWTDIQCWLCTDCWEYLAAWEPWVWGESLNWGGHQWGKKTHMFFSIKYNSEHKKSYVQRIVNKILKLTTNRNFGKNSINKN